MPIDNTKLKQLYDTLKQGGYKKDYNNFRTKFLGNENYPYRQKVYNLISQNGEDYGSSYGEFMQRMQVAKPTAAASAAPKQPQQIDTLSTIQSARDTIFNPKAAVQLGGKVAQQAVKYEQTQDDAATKPFDVNQANAFVENMRLQNEAAQRQHQNVNDYLQHTAGQFGKNATQLGFKGQSNPGLPLAPKNQDGAFIDALGREYENETEARLAQTGAQHALEALTEANMQHNDPKNYLLEQKARIEKELNARSSQLERATDRIPSFATGVAGNAMTQAAARLTDKLQDKKYKALTMQLDKVNQALDTLDEAEHAKASDQWIADSSNWIERAGKNVLSFGAATGRSFKRQASKLSNWDFGFSDLAGGLAIFDAVDKADKGGVESLSPEQRKMLDLYAYNNHIQGENKEHLGWGNTAGMVTAQALPFMLEMTLNPASGVGKFAQRKAMQWAVKKYGKEKLKQLAKRYLLAKAGTRIAGDWLGAATMSATTGQARVAADAVQRRIGEVETDIDNFGRVTYGGHKNGVDWGEAFGKAFLSNTIENQTEMAGDYFGIIGKAFSKGGQKALDKIGLGFVNDFMRNVSSTKVAKAVTDFENATHWNGTTGEYLEEVLGNVENALMVGDSTFDTDKDTGVFNVDKNIETFLSVAVMGGFLSAVKTASYTAPKKRALNEMADIGRQIDGMLGNNNAALEQWGTWSNTFINGTDEEKKQTLREVMDNQQLPMGFRMAFLEYTKAAQKYHGIAQAEQKRAEEGTLDPIGQALDQSYEEGYGTTEPTERQMAYRRLNETRAKVAQLLELEEGEDLDEAMGNDPIGYIHTLEEQGFTPEQIQPVLDYANAQATYEGMMQQREDRANEQADAVKREVRQITHRQNGQIQKATLDGEREVYVLNGKVVLYPDGTGVDKQESDDVLYVQDVQTGELFTIAPNRISELAEPTDPQAVIAEREEEIAAAMNQEIAQEEGAEGGTTAPEPTTIPETAGVDALQGGVSATQQQQTAPTYENGSRFTLDLPNGSAVNGVVLQVTSDGVEVQTSFPVNGRFVQVFPTDEFDGMLSSVRDEADDVIWSREVAEGENAANGQQREMQGNGIPVDANTGEPVYDAVAPDVAWDAIVQEAEGDEAMAMQVVTDIVADMEAKVQKAKKAKVRAGSSVREKLEAQKKHKRRIEEAEAQLEAWRRIAAVKAERIAAAERAKIEAAQQREVTQDDETEVPDFVFDKPENARERGYRMQNGQRADRQEPIAAAVGKEVSVKFTNKVSQPVRVAVVDARSLQPSHQNGQPNVLHFLPEAQPKKRTDHESVHAAEQMAAQMNPEEITSSVTAYTGAPSVNARGEVIQGNNRTAALKRMWQGYPEQAAAYKQYLMDHASEYGLNPEDIAAMEQPVLVNLMDVTDEQAIELGQYDVKDTESGGTERIKPRNVSQKMGDKAERFASILLRTTDEDASVSQLIDEHAVETLKWLEAQHYISPTQYRSAFNADGQVTPEAKNDLRGILYQAVFKNGSERLEDMFNALPAKAQRAILATAYRDFSTPESEKMLPEIQNSIVAFYELSQDAAFANAKNFEEARKATMAWLQQMQFDFSTGQSVSREGKYTNFALTLAAMYKVQTQTAIQQTFNDMFDLLQGRQQPDLLFNPNPNNTPRTLAEAIREVLNIEYDGTNGSHALGGNNETRTTGRQGSARDDSAGGTDAPGNETADAEGGTVQTDNERGRQRNLRHTPRREKNNLSKTEELKFSEELDQNGHPFILSSDGTTVFGEITKNSGLTAAPIKLNEGFNKTDEEGNNIGYGLLHIQAGHGQQILEAGYPSVQKFVEDVCRNYKEIRIGRNRKSNQTYMLIELHDEKHKCTLYVELSHDGTYWNVNSGGIFRNKYTDKNDIVWPEPTVGSNANTDTAEVANNPTEVAKGETVDRGGNSSQPISSESKDTPENSAVQTSGQENAETSLQSEVTRAEQQTNAEPTEGQKEAGNYKKGRVKVGPFDVVIEQPRGSVRSGVDANGKAWETTMQNTYGYFGGTKGVDGDAIDVFLGNDLDGWDGTTVFVVDQYNPDGSFDEHKVMLGFNSQEEAEAAYFANYEADWAKTHRTEVTAVPLADFNEWVNSSKRKTKAFAEYKVAKRNAELDAHNEQNEQLAEQLFSMAKEAETEKDFFDRAASLFEVTGYQSDLRDIYNGVKSGEIANARALSFYTNATLKPVKVKSPKSEQKQKAEAPRQSGYERKHWHADSSLEEMLAREKYLQNAMSFGTKEMAEVFPMAEEWQRDREELMAKYGNDLKNALPNDVKNAFLKKHRNTFANQTALNDELYELRSAIISHKEKAASRAEAAAKEQKAEEANKRFGDFLNGKTPLRRASIVKALTRVSNFGKEGSMTMAQFIEKHVAEGTLELRTKEVDKLQGPSRRQLNRMDASPQAQAENRVKQAGKKTEYLINGFVANKTAYEYAEHLLATKNSKAGEKPRKHAAQPGASAVSTQEATLRDALVDVAQQSGLEVVVDEKAQQVLDEVNGNGAQIRLQAKLSSLAKAAKVIHNWIARNAQGKVFTIELPESTRRMIRNVMGRDFDSHNITINGIRHGLNNHGVEGKKLNANSIPIREEDAELIPYIMTAPDYVRKGSEDVTGRESVRFYKTLSNGYVVVVEKEYKNSPNDMETINIWAEMSSEATNAQRRAVPDTNVQNAILSTDAAKIRKDAEDAIRKEEKLREHRVLTADNGEPSNLPEKQWHEVRTDEFKNWFGDWQDSDEASQVVDENGEPLIVYHGTDADFSIFDRGLLGKNTDENASDEAFARTAHVGFWFSTQQIPWVDKHMPVYLNFRNPLRFDSLEEMANAVGEAESVEAYLNELRSAGYDSIIVEADEEYGGTSYVALEPNQIKSATENVGSFSSSEDDIRYFRTPGGEAYGFTVDGKIYLDPRIATAETPIHEYAHLWADMIRNVNAEAWNDIVGLMKATPIWEEVRGLYPELKTDDEIADEVLAHYSGRRGAERLREAQQQAAAETGKSVFERAAAVAAIERVKQALAKFWQSVAELFHIRFTSAEEVADRVLADMLNGVNPNKVRNSSSVNVAEFAAKHHLNQNDIKKYADAMKSGNLGGASDAFKNIKRSVLLANEGLSLGQFAKVFKPIKNELFSNFGNVEELREEHVQEALNNRNVMEAARKREEAEKEAERKRLEVFEQMSDEALDKAYMEAVRNNDEQRMRDLVNEAARRKGYQSTDEFRMSHRAPSYDEDGTDKSLIDVANNKDNIRDSLEEQFRMNRDRNREESVAAIRQALQEIEQGKNPTVTIYRAVPKSLKEGSVRNGDWVTLSEAYAKQHGRHALNGDYRIMKENVPAANLYWDGNDINEWGYDDKRDYKYKDTRNNRKLNDLIVRDDKGAIIPLSKRFNTRKKDVRFQFVGQQGAAALDKAEEATMRLDNLGVAREMESQQKDAKAIKLATGWERGGDGKWRYEIVDGEFDRNGELHPERRALSSEEQQELEEASVDLQHAFQKGISINENEMDMVELYVLGGMERSRAERLSYLEDKKYELSRLPKHLDDYLDNEELYQAYPELRNVRIVEGNRNMVLKGSFGFYDQQDKSITLYSVNQETLVHEVQHAIQYIEGFAEGGSPNFLSARRIKNIFNEVTEQIKQLRAEGKDAEADALIKKNRGLYNAYMNHRGEAFRNYKALGGEVEARNVQKRLHMTPEERRQSLAEETEDVARKDQIFIMENVGKADSLGDSASFDEHQNEDLKAVNERFNEQLGILTEKNADSMVFSLGRPSVVLQSAGVMNKPMKLYGNKVMKKMRKHGFALEELRDLPRAVADPIAVFNNYGEDGNRSILTELRTQQGNFLVTLSTGVDQDVDFDIVSSVFGKRRDSVAGWINKGYMRYVDKEKALNYLHLSAPIAEASDKAELSSATKVVKDFVNPQLSEENNFREGKGELSYDMLSYLNDPMAQMMGKPRGTKKQRAQFAERERGRMQAHAEKLVERLHLPNVEIVTDALQLEGKQRTAKGFYNKRTGKITIVLPNHASTADVEQTLLHEAVAHYGLRQLFGEHFDDFLDMVYRNAEEGIRRKIAEASAKHGWNVRTATEEYLADLAERTDFEHASPQWWAKIKGFFLDMLRGLGFEAMDGQTLTDNELRYVLWRSYENLTEPGKYPTFIAEARDVAKQHALQVGRFAPTETAGSRVAENEALSEEEMSEILFRDGNDYQYTQALARDRYERRIKSGMYKTQEALQDSMLGLRTAMESILEAEGRKGVYIEDIDGFENAYLGENRLSSVNQAEAEKFAREVFAPMLEEVSKLAPTAEERAKLIDYLFAKHGLERNEVMARRAAAKEARKEFEKELRTAARAVAKDPLDQDAEDALDDVKQRMQEREDALYSENRQKTDYAGLTTLTGKAAVADAELMANDMVDAYENAHDTNALWDAINTVTQRTLKKSFDTGMISRDTYDDIRSMYQFYIPLRGFDERTSNEEYAYLGGTESVFSSPIKSSKGRRSKADDPFAYMQMMAESAIAQGNRNQLVKQKLLNFALNHPSDLISVSELWLRRDPITDQWSVVQPGDLPGTDKLEDSDTAEMVSQKMEQFEQVMQQLALQNPDDFVRQKDRPDIPYRVVNAREMQQHQVMVKRNGKTYVLTINGNPRAAQAVNGLTNPNNDMSGAIGVMARSVESANRWLSSVYTTRNPDFVLTNLARDAGYTNTMVWLKEDSSYAVNFNRNYATRANLVNMIRLYSRLMKGQLDLTDPTEMLFSQFISNGGETGYTAMRDLDAHKTKIKKELKKLSSDPSVRKVWNASFDMLDLFNKAAENSARFAAFITSREAGRTLDRSIYDAKEISVNFNKKGAGAKFLDSYGAQVKNDIRDLSWKNPNLLKLTKDVAIYLTVFSSGVGRSFFAFWNAAIQGSTNFGRVVKRHPKKALTAMAIMFALGLANAMVGASGDDDDDAEEGNGYFDLLSNTRRSNLMLRINGKSWASIPLPVEFRAVYGMGELLGSVLSGKERYTNQELVHEVLCQVSQVLPLDVVGEGSGAFVPTFAKPAFEVLTNESWTGLPIYKQTAYNERDPAYTKAYSNTNKQLVGMSKMLNELSGGDSQKSGWLDVVNPAVVEHLGRGYLGGYFNLVDKLVKTGETVVGSREYDPSNLLIVNRFVKSGSERTAYRAINNRYYQIKADSEELIKDYKGYNYETETGKRDYSQKIAQMKGSPELLSAMAAHEYITKVDKYNKAIKSEQDEVLKKRMEKELYELKSAMIHTVDSILDQKQTLRKAE